MNKKRMSKQRALFHLRIMLDDLLFIKEGMKKTQLRYWTDEEIENGKEITYPESLTGRIEAIQLAMQTIEQDPD